MLATYATVVLGFNLLLGLATIIWGTLRGRPPIPMGVLHGLVGGTGYLLLLASLFTGARNGALIGAAIVFTLVAAMGAGYGVAHWRGKAPPPWIMFIHGVFAIIGFVFLYVGTFMAGPEL